MYWKALEEKLPDELRRLANYPALSALFEIFGMHMPQTFGVTGIAYEA